MYCDFEMKYQILDHGLEVIGYIYKSKKRAAYLMTDKRTGLVMGEWNRNDRLHSYMNSKRQKGLSFREV